MVISNVSSMEIILNSLYKHNTEFIICGDIIINYRTQQQQKNQLDNFLATYNLIDIVFFPTRIVNNSVTLIDNTDLQNFTFFF